MAPVKILFVTWAGGGNSTPVLGLATRLCARGHAVHVTSPDDQGSRFSAVGITHELLARASLSVTEAIIRIRPDVVVVDFMMPSWLAQAEASGLPTVALVHTLYDRVAAGILTAFTSLDDINTARRELGLDTVESAPELLARVARTMVTTPRPLDTASEVPANILWVGAVLEEPGPDSDWRPPASDDRPMAVVSLGTTVGLGDERLLPCILEALSSLPIRAVINAGGHVETSALAVPDNVAVLGYVRHAAVMPHADVVVTHAGLGTVLAALSFGTPMVCVPLGRDQPHNAERVAELGAGVVLSSDATAPELRDAVTAVLADPGFRAAAAPFMLEFDPRAQTALAELEALGRPLGR